VTATDQPPDVRHADEPAGSAPAAAEPGTDAQTPAIQDDDAPETEAQAATAVGATADGAAAEDDEAEPGDEAVADRSGRRTAVLAALGALTLALAVLTAYLAVGYHRARARSAAEAEVLAPAKAAAARILSYDYRHIDQDATDTAAVLTGQFHDQYLTVMRQQIVPQAPKQRAVVAAEVLAAGVSGISPNANQASVVVFANQTVSNTATPQPSVAQVRVRLTLDHINGHWLVSKVDAL
jgi:Mce-associated membrane protein